MNPLGSLLLCLAVSLGLAGKSDAIIFLDTADPTHNTTTPGDNSGWQYEGKFGYFLGVPIAPHFFITAAHILGVSVGNKLNFHGDEYTTIAKYPITGTDLQVWEVDHAKPFLTYAPLSTGAGNVGATATVMGRGTQRGAEVLLDTVPKGWKPGTGDQVQRWGRNVIAGTATDPAKGAMLVCQFNNSGITDECHLSSGDSGGGLFVLENGLWRLAGINYAVDGNFRIPATESTPAGPEISAALFDMGGLEIGTGSNWTLTSDTMADIPSSFYSSRISVHTSEIQAITGGDGSLPAENYAAWQTLYFSPTEIANPSLTDHLADYDADGIPNLMEFALNLEPIFNAQTRMTAATGLSGLPLVRLEHVSGMDHLTLEFVRRKAASGSGLTYAPQFSSDLETWGSGGTETVTSINPRWERVKVVDPETTGSETKRFARVKVSM